VRTSSGEAFAMSPLLTVTYSTLVQRPRFADGLRRCARILLDAGADRDATWTPSAFPDARFGALYGAAGHTHDPVLTKMLLEAGADPNDGESLYHSTERSDLACTRLLLEAGATLRGTNALFHMLDRDDLAGLELFLAHGGDPNELSTGLDRPLHHAIRRGRSLFASNEQPIGDRDWLDCARALVAHGMPRPPSRYTFSDDVESYFANDGTFP
jgi:ankyrin repeat protein